jgi:hypothetical protein
MNYFALKAATPEDAPDDLDLSKLPPDEWFFGKPFKSPKVVIKLSKLKNILDIWWCGSWFLMSGRAIDVLRGVGETHFQEHPVTLVAHGTRDSDSARIIHLLDRVSCMDKKASKFTSDSRGQVDEVTRLVLNEKKIPKKRHLFELGEAGVIIADEQLVKEWQAIKVRGCKFVPLEEYTY